MSDWLEERMREDEWRFATMEYGGQCVTMAGIKWMQMSSTNSLVLTIKELYQPVTATLELVEVQYYLKMSDAIKATQCCLSVWI